MRIVESKTTKAYVFREMPPEMRVRRRMLASPVSSSRRMLNKYLADSAFRRHAQVLSSMPYSASIDPSSVCMLKCPLCPTGLGDKARPKLFMEFALFRKIMDEIGDYLLIANLYNWGEPLLNPRIVDMISYSRKVKKIPAVFIDSNLNAALPDSFFGPFVSSGLNEIRASIDGATQKTYEIYRREGRLDRVLGNLEKIVKARHEAGQGPYIIWSYLVFRHNEHEMDKAREIAEGMGVDLIAFRSAEVTMGTRITDPFESNLELSADVLPELGSRFSSYTKEGGRKLIRARCDWLWRKILINADGSVSPCCGVFQKALAFGDAAHENIRQIWNNEHYLLARQVAGHADLARKLQADGVRNVCVTCAMHGNYLPC